MAQCVTQIALGDTLVLKWYLAGSQRMEEYLLLHEGGQGSMHRDVSNFGDFPLTRLNSRSERNGVYHFRIPPKKAGGCIPWMRAVHRRDKDLRPA